MNELTIAVFPGDGIGPEVMAAARAVLDVLAERHRLELGGSATCRDVTEAVIDRLG